MEIKDPEIFEKTKETHTLWDYVLIANLKSGVEDKKYSDVEFDMWSLFTVLKQQTIQTMTMFQSERSFR